MIYVELTRPDATDRLLWVTSTGASHASVGCDWSDVSRQIYGAASVATGDVWSNMDGMYIGWVLS